MTQKWLWIHHPPHTTITKTQYQQYLSCYWPDFDHTKKVGFCPSKICTGNIVPHQQYLSGYQPNFDWTLKICFWDNLYQMLGNICPGIICPYRTVLVNRQLLARTVLVKKELLTGTVSVNKKLLTRTVPVNKELLTGRVPVNNLFLFFSSSQFRNFQKIFKLRTFGQQLTPSENI